MADLKMQRFVILISLFVRCLLFNSDSLGKQSVHGCICASRRRI